MGWRNDMTYGRRRGMGGDYGGLSSPCGAGARIWLAVARVGVRTVMGGRLPIEFGFLARSVLCFWGALSCLQSVRFGRLYRCWPAFQSNGLSSMEESYGMTEYGGLWMVVEYGRRIWRSVSCECCWRGNWPIKRGYVRDDIGPNTESWRTLSERSCVRTSAHLQKRANCRRDS